MSDQMAEAIQRQMAHAQRSAFINRRDWTDQQWIDDARSQMGDLDGSILDLVNGHVMALLRRLDELEGRCSPLRHGGRPCEVAAITEEEKLMGADLPLREPGTVALEDITEEE